MWVCVCVRAREHWESEADHTGLHEITDKQGCVNMCKMMMRCATAGRRCPCNNTLCIAQPWGQHWDMRTFLKCDTETRPTRPTRPQPRTLFLLLFYIIHIFSVRIVFHHWSFAFQLIEIILKQRAFHCNLILTHSGHSVRAQSASLPWKRINPLFPARLHVLMETLIMWYMISVQDRATMSSILFHLSLFAIDRAIYTRRWVLLRLEDDGEPTDGHCFYFGFKCCLFVHVIANCFEANFFV